MMPSTFKHLKHAPAILASLPLILVLKLFIYAEGFLLNGLAVWIASVQALFLGASFVSGTEGLKRLLFGADPTFERGLSVPAPDTPPGEDVDPAAVSLDGMKSAPPVNGQTSFGPTPPATPRAIFSVFRSKPPLSVDGASSVTGSTELRDTVLRLRSLRRKADKLSDKTNGRMQSDFKEISSFPLTSLSED